MLPTQSSRTAPVPGSSLQVLCPHACCLPNLSSSALSATTLCSAAVCADCLRPSGLWFAPLTAPKIEIGCPTSTTVSRRFCLPATSPFPQNSLSIPTCLHQ